MTIFSLAAIQQETGGVCQTVQPCQERQPCHFATPRLRNHSTNPTQNRGRNEGKRMAVNLGLCMLIILFDWKVRMIVSATPSGCAFSYTMHSAMPGYKGFGRAIHSFLHSIDIYINSALAGPFAQEQVIQRSHPNLTVMSPGDNHCDDYCYHC